jgi:hypothetical protein
LNQKILNTPFEEARAKMVGQPRLCHFSHPLTLRSLRTGGGSEGTLP